MKAPSDLHIVAICHESNEVREQTVTGMAGVALFMQHGGCEDDKRWIVHLIPWERTEMAARDEVREAMSAAKATMTAANLAAVERAIMKLRERQAEHRALTSAGRKLDGLKVEVNETPDEARLVKMLQSAVGHICSPPGGNKGEARAKAIENVGALIDEWRIARQYPSS